MDGDNDDDNEKSKIKKINVEFAPGCFDDFDGTQEELDDIIKQIQDMAQTGELLENSSDFDYNYFDGETTDSYSNPHDYSGDNYTHETTVIIDLLEDASKYRRLH